MTKRFLTLLLFLTLRLLSFAQVDSDEILHDGTRKIELDGIEFQGDNEVVLTYFSNTDSLLLEINTEDCDFETSEYYWTLFKFDSGEVFKLRQKNVKSFWAWGDHVIINYNITREQLEKLINGHVQKIRFECRGKNPYFDINIKKDKFSKALQKLLNYLDDTLNKGTSGNVDRLLDGF